MDTTKIYAAGIEYSKATEILSDCNDCGINVRIDDNDSILEIVFSPKSGYSFEDQDLEKIKNTSIKRLGQNTIKKYSTVQESVVELLKEKSLKLATAESCTSGLISSKITEISGASEVFDYGLSAYSNNIKIKALDVQETIIEQFGAVSSQTAAQMAIGAMRVSNADIGLSITGVAGPGKSEGKPVGLIYIGLCDTSGLWVLKLELDGTKYNREQIRKRAANIALDFVRRYLSFESFGAQQYQGDDSYCVTLDMLYDFSIDTSHKYSCNKPTIKSNNKRNNTYSKKDKILNFFRRTFCCIFVLLSVVFSILLIKNFANEHKELSLNKALINEYKQKSDDFNKYNLNDNGVFELFSSIKNNNNDFYGWISNNNLDINCAVMKTEDDFYRNHNFNKESSPYGMIYIDPSCDINSDTKVNNIILHGNNAENGLAFGNIDKYLDANYYKNNPIIKFDTYNLKGEYIITFVAKLYSEDDFAYNTTNFSDVSEFNDFLFSLHKKALFFGNVTTSFEDELITLVTNMENEQKLIILARKIKKNETIENFNVFVKSNISN